MSSSSCSSSAPTPPDFASLVQGAIAAMGAAGAGAAPLTPAMAAPHSEAQTLAHSFATRMFKLMDTLRNRFPGNEKLGTWTSRFQGMVLGNPIAEEAMIAQWHREMTVAPDGTPRTPTLYDMFRPDPATGERDIIGVFNARVWLLEEIDAYNLYYNSGLSPADQNLVCLHFDKINAEALQYSLLPDTIRHAMDAFMTSGLDPTQPITKETTHAFTQTVMGMASRIMPGAESAIGAAAESDGGLVMMQWAQTCVARLMENPQALQDILKLPGIGALQQMDGGGAGGSEGGMGGGGGMDFGAMLASLQGELAASADVAAAPGAGADSQMGAITAMLAQFAGGAGRGADAAPAITEEEIDAMDSGFDAPVERK